MMQTALFRRFMLLAPWMLLWGFAPMPLYIWAWFTLTGGL